MVSWVLRTGASPLEGPDPCGGIHSDRIQHGAVTRISLAPRKIKMAELAIKTNSYLCFVMSLTEPRKGYDN